jgi:tRNA threonylcarbamoyladenosine biosynthesis protein TsaE
MDHIDTIITKSAQETKVVGQKLAITVNESILSELKEATIFCLYGELGSGKTTFVQGFSQGLDIPSRLLSPTFIIMRRYPVEGKFSFLYHIDLYRVKNVSDIETLGLAEIFTDPSAVVLIEWAERLESLVPKQRTDIHFSVVSDEERNIKIISHK